VQAPIRPDGLETTYELWLEYPACQSGDSCEPTTSERVGERRALAKDHCDLGKVSRPHSHRGVLVVVTQSAKAGRKLAHDAAVAVKLGPKT
jgi:hypothetical protein